MTMTKATLSRRDFGYLFLAGGLLALAYPLFRRSGGVVALQRGDSLRPTPSNSLGPFYRAGAPRTEKLSEANQSGMRLLVSGRVIDTSGQPVPAAVLEVFHADQEGEYDMKGYRCRGVVPVAASGEYRYETVMPGGYGGRAQHIHYRISVPDRRGLITQLYFETDPKFGGNPDQNFERDRLIEHRELIRPVSDLVKNGQTYRAVTFDICLPRA